MTFDLIRKPWILALTTDGRYVQLGLLDTLVQAHQLRMVWAETPMIETGLYRLLIATLHRALNPCEQPVWYRIYNAGRFDPDALAEYLDRWQSRFDLFDPDYPFMQAGDACEPYTASDSTSNRLLMIPASTPTTVQGHLTEDRPAVLSPDYAARALVGHQAGAVAGGRSSLDGRPLTDGPCARGFSFLVEGPTLFDTLCFNLFPVHPPAEDRPFWEADDPFDRDPLDEERQRLHPIGMLDALTWPSRRIRLHPRSDGSVRTLTYTQGLTLLSEGMEDGYLDPCKVYREAKSGRMSPIYPDEVRPFWAHADVWTTLGHGSQNYPLAFRLLQILASHGKLPPITIAARALGLEQAKPIAYYRQRVPLPHHWLGQDGSLEPLLAALTLCNKASGHVQAAASIMASHALAGSPDTRSTLHDAIEYRVSAWRVEATVWQRQRTVLLNMIKRFDSRPLDGWYDALLGASRAALDDCGGADAEVGRPHAAAYLYQALNKLRHATDAADDTVSEE